MKKLLFIIGIFFLSLSAMGQSWDAYYGYIPVDSINAADTLQVLVVDAEKDSTYVLMFSRIRSLGQSEISDSGHNAVTLAGTPDYLTLSGQEITRGQIDLTTDITGVLPDANVANDVTITNISQVADITSSAAEINALDGIPGTLTATEIGYLDGVTSAVQTQINNISSSEDSTTAGYGLNESSNELEVDTTEISTLYQMRTEISDSFDVQYDEATVAVALGDSGVYDEGYATPTDVDEAIATVTGGYSWIHFIVDSTTNAPSSGDSTFVITGISNYKLDIWKGTQYGNLMKLVNRDSIGWTISGDTITIRPAFDAYDNVEIHATANSGVDTLSLYDASDTLSVNILTNGTFDSDTDWTKGASWTISGGMANYDDTGENDLSQADANMASSIEALATYYLTFTISGASGNAQLKVLIANGSKSLYGTYAYYTNGTHTISFVPDSDEGAQGIAIRARDGGSDSSWSIDNITLKKLIE